MASETWERVTAGVLLVQGPELEATELADVILENALSSTGS